MENPLVRPARPEDREAILSFCKRTWDWGDYIGDVWNEWLTDSVGVLLVAVVGEEMAGVGKVTMVSKAEAWLEGLRVNPPFRGQGIAQALYHGAEKAARRRGARVARYATPGGNEAIHRLSERFGYHRVACFIQYRATEEAGTLPERLLRPEVDAAETLLADSSGLAASGGLYDGAWRCRELRGGRLREHLVRGEAYVVRMEGRPAAVALISGHDPEQGLNVGYLGGDTLAVTVLARQLRTLAEKESLQRVHIIIPSLESLEDALRDAGYKRDWFDEMCVYERRLRR